MLTFLCAAIAAVLLYLGLMRPPEAPLTKGLRAGFAVMAVLAAASGYAGYRKAQSLKDLRELIDPVPRITGIVEAPTAGQIQAVAEMAAAIPGDGRTRATREMRSRFARGIDDLPGIRWTLGSSLSVKEVLEHYRDAANRRDWRVAEDRAPALTLTRGRERMAIYVLADPGGSQVLYTYTMGRP